MPAPDVRLFEVEVAPPFERRVLVRLYQALRAAQSAASETLLRTDDLDAFDRQVENGVSSNLCRALARLGGPDGDRGQRPRRFEIDFSWAPGLADRPVTVPVRFSSQLVRVLDLAADELGAVPPEGAAMITGKIKQTRRDEPSQLVQVQVRGGFDTESGPRERAVWLTLDPEWFDRVVEAFRRDLLVSAEGDLSHTGKRMELNPLRYFDILGDG